jgi:hypothetical protein
MIKRRKRIAFAEVVTPDHGERFADEWLRSSHDTGAITEAFSETVIVTWPDDAEGRKRYREIEIEIAHRVADQLHKTAAKTFVRIANDVLSRARRA